MGYIKLLDSLPECLALGGAEGSHGPRTSERFAVSGSLVVAVATGRYVLDHPVAW
ncbi:hypothetical protein [Paenarthrobacter aurescens]|uniref:hypothetical protein n=1 Tax=Paenarthrobacter aurescens TaxID=43663 RepID=UPI0021C103A4|nr:hypothetical protein [Paenarthrobacter aurescens]MCT9871835.1 hypothetical protein [Paenarthrobacter aurescens]